jgi:hypothetical protein
MIGKDGGPKMDVNGGNKQDIIQVCDQIKQLLLDKTSDYGSSFSDPLSIFSSASAEERVRSRIDDKLKRLQQIQEKREMNFSEDTLDDLIGYLILLKILLNRKITDKTTPIKSFINAIRCGGVPDFIEDH